MDLAELELSGLDWTTVDWSGLDGARFELNRLVWAALIGLDA